MIKISLSKILNKTVWKNEFSTQYKINAVDIDLVKKITSSRFISDGVYSFEQIIKDGKSEYVLVVPSFDKYNLPTSCVLPVYNEEAIIYEIHLNKPYFLPLDTKEFIGLFNFMKKYESITQILFTKRIGQWREDAISQYEAFLKGNESPFSNKIIRSIQSNVLYMLTKLSNSNLRQEPIPEIEEKILEDGYRFECRIALFDIDKIDKFEYEIRNELNKLNYFNQLKISRGDGLNQDLNKRSFTSLSANQTFSFSEILSMIHDETSKGQCYVKTMKNDQCSLEDSKIERSYLQNAISILPDIHETHKITDKNKVRLLTQALKRTAAIKHDVIVNRIHNGSSLQVAEISIPKGISYTSIRKKIEDIRAAMGNTSIEVEIGDKPDTANFYIPNETRNPVYFKKIIESHSFKDFLTKSNLPFVIGEKINGELMFADLSKLRHLLISGTSGSGKSVFVTLIIITLLITVPPDEISLYLIDPKIVEFTMFSGFPQTKELITDMKKAFILLEKLCVEMDRRYELMSRLGVKDLQTYNLKSNRKIPYIVTVIDELSDLMMTNRDVENYIVRIAQKGRAAGVHLILATQRPSVDVVTGLIKANMPARIAFKTTSGVDSKTIIDTVGAEKLLGLGDGLAKIEGNSKELERFQAPVLTLNKEKEDSIYFNLKELFVDTPTYEDILGEIVHLEPINKLKKIIATSNETRISELQKEMGIRINDVSNLVKQLVIEGWLEKQGKSYKIIIDENELIKWRK